VIQVVEDDGGAVKQESQTVTVAMAVWLLCTTIFD
jgi:hypothetical protein